MPPRTMVALRMPDTILEKIDVLSGVRDRSKWILEACRMRLLEALLAICAGRPKLAPLAPEVCDALFEDQRPIRIPICGKDWWEDGEHYECLMDAGHRETKHGMRDMVRVLS